MPDPTHDHLISDAAQERLLVARLAVLAARRPDLAPLCELLAEEAYRRAGTAVMLSRAFECPPRPWWWRLREAWRMVVRGR